ncbi:MAG TPA: hypothetical protein VGJ45_24985 [Pseudonocardiaceae bacterium]
MTEPLGGIVSGVRPHRTVSAARIVSPCVTRTTSRGWPRRHDRSSDSVLSQTSARLSPPATGAVGSASAATGLPSNTP